MFVVPVVCNVANDKVLLADKLDIVISTKAIAIGARAL